MHEEEGKKDKKKQSHVKQMKKEEGRSEEEGRDEGERGVFNVRGSCKVRWGLGRGERLQERLP